MTFIGKIIAGIVSLFTSAEKVIQKTIAPIAITVTNFLKTVTVLDANDLLGSIAGSAGKAFEDKLRAALPGIVADLQLAQAFLATNPTPDELISKVVTAAQSLTGDTKTAFWIEFAGKVTKALADGDITLAESILLTQAVYHDPAPVAA